MRCGECGSSILAEKKYKNLSNGTRKRYTYYMCTKYTRRNCSQTPINENDLVPQLIEIMDGVNIDKFLLRKEYEVKRFHKFTDQLSNHSQKEIQDNVDIRSQMKYIVEKGSTEEKKRLLKNLGAKIYLKDKKIFLK